LFIVAPLSADTLAKLSHGLADNLLTSVARAWSFDKPILAVPAMNTAMWDHPLTAPQLEVLTKLGFNLVAPVSKMLACGDVGTGAMAAVDDIVTAARALLLRRDALGTVAEVRVSEENRT
jgi:phosphopantothenoylcysteine decarboxylase